MKLRNCLLAIPAAFGFFWAGCDNEIDLTAPYKETTVVYGLLNPKDTEHIVRIQKAYLGDGNLQTMASIHDSTYYPDILDVQLVRIKNGNPEQSIPMTRFIGPPKHGGVFPSEPNILYKTNGETIFPDSDYRLVVKNTQTGNTVTAQTPLVDSIRIIKPAVNNFNSIAFSSPAPYVVEFSQANNARVYGLTIRFHYKEYNIQQGNIDSSKYIDWVFPNKLISNPAQYNSIEIPVVGEEFYKFVGQKLVADPNLQREAGVLDFYLVAGAEFLSNYLLINQASTSILTSVPEYSNVEGGTGIFSSRAEQASLSKPLSSASKDLLKTSPYTSNLNFQ